MVSIDQFLELVSRFAEASGISEATASTRLFNDGKRMQQLRNGGDVGIRKVEAAMHRMSECWPEGVVWPRQIKRPKRV